MTIEQTRTRQVSRDVEAPVAAATGPSTLAEQAAAYGQVARDAHADCDKNEQAEKTLQARRNRSAQ